jgi:hypothetical protein
VSGFAAPPSLAASSNGESRLEAGVTKSDHGLLKVLLSLVVFEAGV